MESAREHVANALQAYQSLSRVQLARECDRGPGKRPCADCAAFVAIATRMTKALERLDTDHCSHGILLNRACAECNTTYAQGDGHRGE
jgi:hypothetical protein